MSQWDKQTKSIAAVITLSLVSLGLALISRAVPTTITYLPKDVEWLLFLSIAMLLPLYRSQIFNEGFLKGDIEKLQSDVTDIKRISSAGVVKFVGKANEAASHVIDRMRNASEVYNTYIIDDGPYTPTVSASVKHALKTYLEEERGIWEETVSRLGSERVIEV